MAVCRRAQICIRVVGLAKSGILHSVADEQETGHQFIEINPLRPINLTVPNSIPQVKVAVSATANTQASRSQHNDIRIRVSRFMLHLYKYQSVQWQFLHIQLHSFILIEPAIMGKYLDEPTLNGVPSSEEQPLVVGLDEKARRRRRCRRFAHFIVASIALILIGYGSLRLFAYKVRCRASFPLLG
ncbi:hypothetical protein AG1IA_09888 [Rhizoctonia solani AG-1 IA]|uniref:Uncharacterized protein n=1 Tax=Thanatephorus cucumeris (strain AG1-IA) TaxID=983506 RepID=L8WH73_THACA|nr:hypothetical protein AG1IA_09888 [Rhizoctonia solani AG-1 IA]